MHIFLPQALVLAATQTSAATGQTAQGPAGPDLQSLMIMMAVIFLLFWMIFLKPQKREQLKREQMMDGLGKGDKVMTTGGMLGTVESVDKAKGIVSLTIAPKVVVDFSRAAIANVIQKKGSKPAGDKSDAEVK